MKKNLSMLDPRRASLSGRNDEEVLVRISRLGNATATRGGKS